MRRGLVITMALCAAATSAAQTSQAAPLVGLEQTQRVFARPGAGEPHSLVDARRPITGVRTVLPVLKTAVRAEGRRWLKVSLPGRPNGSTGWIRAGATQPLSTPWRIVVETARRRVIVIRGDRVVRRFRAIVGAPSTPTPNGRFFVEESVALRAPLVGGPLALALSARSTVLRQFAGGPGQIALHGRGGIGGVLGTAVSHGCVRLGDPAINWLAARIGPGVPVTIVRRATPRLRARWSALG